MANFRFLHASAQDGIIEINTNGRPFFIREIRAYGSTTPRHTINRYCMSPVYSHEDLKNSESMLKSGFTLKFHGDDGVVDGEFFTLILSVF